MSSEPGVPPLATAESAGALAARRRLTRSRSDRWIAGVAGGLGEYLAVDPMLVRVAFFVLALASAGAAVLFYLLAAFIIPDANAGQEAHRRGGAIAGVVLGLLLVGFGVVWLLAALDIETPRWDVVLSVALIAVGGALVITAGRAGSGGLVILGLLLTVVLSGVSAVTPHMDSAFSERSVRPASMAAVEREYSHAFGSFTLDLSSVEFPEGTTHIRVANAFGDTTVRLPARVAARVTASTVFGETRVFGKASSGVVANQPEQTPDYDRATHRVEIELNTVFGSSEVRR
jgi:phage shock protein C